MAALLAGCGDAPSDSSQSAGATGYGAQVASYDLSTDGPQRFIVGLLGPDGATVVGGEVLLDFTFLGDGTEPGRAEAIDPQLAGLRATFLPVADGEAPTGAERPRLRANGESIGVYEAEGIRFPRAGFWSVTVRATIGQSSVNLEAAFDVAEDNEIVQAGDAAPRTVNHLPGTSAAPVDAVDSRAEDDGSVPDPELHETTVADAIDSGLPTLVVVSTPVYCESRFCGPITESIQSLAQRIDDEANFVHIEVWRDFEKNTLNAGAAEWIYPKKGVEAAEPWVFLVDGSGVVTQRWDNVANEADVETAVRALIS